MPILAQAEATIRGIISDLDGVVYRGETPIPDAMTAFGAWRRQDVPYAFVTNNSTRSAAQVAAKLRRMGVHAAPAQVFTAISATANLMRRRRRKGSRVFAIGEQPLLDALAEGAELIPACLISSHEPIHSQAVGRMRQSAKILGRQIMSDFTDAPGQRMGQNADLGVQGARRYEAEGRRRRIRQADGAASRSVDGLGE